jgi:hypothetical protein
MPACLCVSLILPPTPMFSLHADVFERPLSFLIFSETVTRELQSHYGLTSAVAMMASAFMPYTSQRGVPREVTA